MNVAVHFVEYPAACHFMMVGMGQSHLHGCSNDGADGWITTLTGSLAQLLSQGHFHIAFQN